jgi:signal transduction histidine kinase
MKLSVKFTGVILVASLVPLAGVGVRVVRETDRSLRAGAVRLQQNMAQQTVQTVENQLDGAVNLLFVAAHAGAGEHLLNSYPILMDLWVLDAAGQKQYAVHRLAPSPGITPALWASVKRQIAQRGYYAGPWETPPGIAPRRLLAVPSMNKTGQTSGYLVARINLFVLSESLKGLDLGSQGRAYLITEDGRLLAHSSSDNLFKTPFVCPREWLSPTWQDGEHPHIDNTKVLAARAPLPGQGAWAFYLQPLDTALAPVTALKNRLRHSLVLAAGGALLLAVALSGLVTRPLQKFHAAIRGMQEGRFDRLVDVRSSDELGDMARVIQEAQPALEKKVRDSVLGKMARLLGHDLRQPVVALRNSMDTLFTHVRGADDVARAHMDLIRDSLDWMDDFIEDILTVGRERPLAARRMGIPDLVQAVLTKLKVPENIKLTTTVDDKTPLCPIDEKEARKAVANLLTNAFEALGGEGRVDISAAPQENGAALTIADNGPGIPEEKKARLFEEFTTKSSGTGLGLLVVKRVMERHGGKVVIDSGPQGTRVTLWFPGGQKGPPLP